MTTPGGQLTPGDDTTPPVYGVPDGAYVGDAGAPNAITDLNNLTEAEAKRRMQAPINPSFIAQRDGVWQDGGLLGNIANFLFGAGAGSPAARLSDGMTELNERIDLMTQVSGFGAMIMSQNRTMTGGYKVVPFDTPYGPYTEHSVEVDTDNHQFVLSRGTWSVNVLLTVPPHGLLGGVGWHRATVTSYRPDGTEHMNQWLDWRSGENPHSFFAQVPLVVPEDGYTVKIRYQANGVIWPLLGGTDRSKFWVNRWDLRTDNNNVIINPGDGPDV